MIRKTLSPLSPRTQTRVRVTFELPSCTWACRIFVCGDFNQWDKSALQMRQDRDGVWRASVDLEPNQQYQFRYLIDGNWQTDYHADGWSESGFGSQNSIVDTGQLPDLIPAESALLAEFELANPPELYELQTYSARRPAPYPDGSLVVEERVTIARRPVSQPAHAPRRAA